MGYTKPISIKKVLYQFIHYWWVILLSFILAEGITYGITTYYITPIYEAQTTLYVHKSHKKLQNNISETELLVHKQLVKEFELLLKSPSILERSIQKLELDTNIQQLKKQVYVEVKEGTRIFILKVRNYDPEKAKAVANTIVEMLKGTVKDNVGIEDIQVIDEARKPLEPIAPNLVVNMVIVGSLSILDVMILIFFIMQIGNSKVTVEEEIDIEVIGRIPIINQKTIKPPAKISKRRSGVK